jgi:hypothetical protein
MRKTPDGKATADDIRRPAVVPAKATVIGSKFQIKPH